MGRTWEEHGARARTPNSTQVGIYNEKSAYKCAPHGFINRNITHILRFGRTQWFREGFTQSFINEAPGGLMYEGCVRKKTWRSTFRCMKREMTVEMCGAPRQLHGWRTHVSTAIVPLATLRGDA